MMDGVESNGYSGAAAAPARERDLYRIGEVSRLTATKPFVLRYWETEFPMLQPVKSPKGHRLYRQEDIDTVFAIKRLLYDEGFTIAGARRHLREHGIGMNEEGAGSVAVEEGDASGENEPRQEAQGVSRNGAQMSAQPPAPSRRTPSPDLAMLNRQTLLDLRDSLRSLLTALESE